ncbi:MAG: hypothetical protein ABJC04_07105 [Verrucomicrobiota bacterium]
MRQRIETSKHGDYWWLTSDSSLGILLEHCPEIVLGRFVAVTAFDSSPLKLTQDELNRGWSENDCVAWSPKILTTDILPHDGWDEWYIFPSQSLFKPKELFVNLGSIGLRDPAYLLENIEPTWDRAGVIMEIERRRHVQKRFWSQLFSIRPETYLADGDELIFATSNSELFARVTECLKSKFTCYAHSRS